MTFRAFNWFVGSYVSLRVFVLQRLCVVPDPLVGTHFPCRYGSLIVLILLNPCLSLLHKWFRRSWPKPLGGREPCLIMALVPACAFLISSFRIATCIDVAHHYAKTNASWKSLQEDGKTYKPVTPTFPSIFLLIPRGRCTGQVYQGARTDSSNTISLVGVPWKA